MKLFRQFILLTLTLLVLVSATGVTVGKHLCGGELQNLRLFRDAKDCPMDLQKPTLLPCHTSDENTTPDHKPADDCCEDTKIVVDNIDHNAPAKASLEANAYDLKFVATAYVVLANLLFPEANTEASYLAYASPPIVRDIPVLVQSFLI